MAAGDGIENTTRLLVETGWRGLWVEAGDAEADCIRHLMRTPLDDRQLTFVNEKVTLDNIEAMVRDSGYVTPTISPSISTIIHRISGGSSHSFAPRLFCIEYNGHFPPSMSFEVPYREDKVWTGTNRFGASLKALEDIGRKTAISWWAAMFSASTPSSCAMISAARRRLPAPLPPKTITSRRVSGRCARRGHARHLPFGTE